MPNNHKNFIQKILWFKSEDEYNQLTNAINTNEKDKVLDIIFKIYLRGDL